jgi:hypothetical protein
MSSTMSIPTYATLRIRFVENDSRPSTDDWVRAVPIHNPNAPPFSQEYTITSRLDGTNFVSKITGGSSLLDQIETILCLVSADDQPCKRVQFDIPNVPTILVDHDRIHNRIPEVVDMLRQLVDSWPQVGTELPSTQSTTLSSVFTNVNWNATATPFVPSSRPTPVTIPQPPFNWNSTTFRSPTARATRRHMFFDDNGNEMIDLTMDSDSE